jgi:hypothetical protein
MNRPRGTTNHANRVSALHTGLNELQAIMARADTRKSRVTIVRTGTRFDAVITSRATMQIDDHCLLTIGLGRSSHVAADGGTIVIESSLDDSVGSSLGGDGASRARPPLRRSRFAGVAVVPNNARAADSGSSLRRTCGKISFEKHSTGI